MKDKREKINSHIWFEIAEPDNPYVSAQSFCHGYDVYGDVLTKASLVDFLYLLFASSIFSRCSALRIMRLITAFLLA